MKLALITLAVFVVAVAGDVSHLYGPPGPPSAPGQYLPPNEGPSNEYLPPETEVVIQEEPEVPGTPVDEGGYRYRAVKRIRYRRRRV